VYALDPRASIPCSEERSGESRRATARPAHPLRSFARGTLVDVRLLRRTLRGPDGRELHLYGNTVGALSSAWPRQEYGALQLRHDMATDTWIALSPARNLRPVQAEGTGAPSPSSAARLSCPLCPGGEEVPSAYDALVFDNRFPALHPSPPAVPGDDPRIAPAFGRCELVVYTPRHQGSLATLTPEERGRLVAIWRDRSEMLRRDRRVRYVLAFENRGTAVGATISHPHGQIYAFGHLPPLIRWRLRVAAAYRLQNQGCLSCRLVADDLAAPDRILELTSSFLVAIPFAPRWPYEVHVRARRHGAARLGDLNDAEQADLACLLGRVVARYDGLFGFDLPYMMVIMEAPEPELEEGGSEDWHLSVEFYPPHRSAEVTKVRASVETATGLFILDVPPEEAAAALRQVHLPPPEPHPVFTVHSSSW
jgi:UDPglucose--hexose-1-phosphate uridylyltransferase